MTPRSGPRESLLLATRLLGVILFVSGLCTIVVRVITYSTARYMESPWDHFRPATYIVLIPRMRITNTPLV